MRRRFVARAVCIGLVAGMSVAVTGVLSSAAGGAVPAAKATGTPIRAISANGFYHLAGNHTPGVNAALKKINATGGIGGRPLEVVDCDGTSLNKIQACARQAASDPTIVAAINIDPYGGFNAIGEAAGLAVLGTPTTASDFSSPNFFSPSVGAFATAGEAAIASDNLKAKHIVLAVLDVPAGAALPTLLNLAVLGPRGAKLSKSVPVPPDAVDMAPIVAAIPSDTDALLIAAAGTTPAKLMLQVRKAGLTFPIVTATSTQPAPDLKRLVGSAATNVYGVSPWSELGPGYRRFLADMKASGYGKNSPDVNGATVDGWLAVQILKSMIEKIGPKNVTREAILSQLRATTAYEDGGLTPPINFAKKQTILGGAVANIVNATVVAYKYDVKNSKYLPLNKGAFVSIFASS